MTLVQIGAGNIGRSFVGQLFARVGYEVVFVDVAYDIIRALNERHAYTIEVRDTPAATLRIEGVRGINARDAEAAAETLAAADIAATAVGPNALPHVFPLIASALSRRRAAGRGPLDIIICENLRDAAQTFRDGLAQHLPEGFPLEESVGLIETSIGKMVPIMPEEVRRQDPLLVYAEAYNTLICDGRAFRNPIPDVPGLAPKQNMKAYVDRKLFVHNLGHAIAAYLGHYHAPSLGHIWEVIEVGTVESAVRGGMAESARALMAEYPGEFTDEGLSDHIDDLVRRLHNRALGDTVYRVGRDLPRKLAPQDRLIGSLRLDHAHGIDAPNTVLGAAAALMFEATDENGEVFGPDRALVRRVREESAVDVLRDVCGLTGEHPGDEGISAAIVNQYARLATGMHP